jgi:hypothetical protein
MPVIGGAATGMHPASRRIVRRTSTRGGAGA